jgi:hypothetical protein
VVEIGEEASPICAATLLAFATCIRREIRPVLESNIGFNLPSINYVVACCCLYLDFLSFPYATPSASGPAVRFIPLLRSCQFGASVSISSACFDSAFTTTKCPTKAQA